MASVGTSKRSAAMLATSRVIDAEVDRMIANGEGRYPNFSTFVPSDLVTDKMISDAHGDGRAVVIVDEHENVRVVPAP